MHETAEELDELQRLLDESFAGSADHLLSIMEKQRRLDAQGLVDMIPAPFPVVLNLATVTAAGQPRLSAVDGHFLHGHWYFTTSADSFKARHIAKRPAVSASYTPRDGFGIFCHGAAVRVEGEEHSMLLSHLGRVYGTEPDDWAAYPAYRIDASWMTGFAMTEDEMKMIEDHRRQLERTLGLGGNGDG